MGNMTRAFLLLLTLACFSTGNSQVLLDPDFGVNGRAFIDITFGFDYVYDMKVQSDGKIVVAGTSGGTPINYAVARFNANGTRDTSFGVNGVVVAPYNASMNVFVGFGLQADGKMLLTGANQISPNVVDYEYMLMRLNADGTPDTTFGQMGNGVVLNDFSFSEAANGPNDIAIQEDQKIIVLGSAITPTNGRDFALIRYNTDGSIDNSFGDAGVQFINFIPTANTDNGSKVKIQPDGKIVVAGFSGPVPSYDLSIARLNIDGSLDSSFGTNGKATFDLGGADRDACLAITPNNEIIVGGTMNYNNSQNSKAIILKLNPDGTSNTTFGDNGRITIAYSDNPKEHLGNFIVQENGKLLVGANSVQDMRVLRYTEDGDLDTTFNGTGSVSVNGNDMEAVNDIALQEDGKILIAGATLEGLDWNFAVERFIDENLSVVNQVDKKFSVYPNPATTTLTISGKSEIKSVLVYNALGQLLIMGGQSKNIDVSHLPIGSYLLKIEAGKDTQVLKFLKN